MSLFIAEAQPDFAPFMAQNYDFSVTYTKKNLKKRSHSPFPSHFFLFPLSKGTSADTRTKKACGGP